MSRVQHRLEVAHTVAPDGAGGVRSEVAFPAGQPVAVAAHGVDLTIVTQHPEGMAERPRRESVRGKSLMVKAERGLVIRVVEIGVKFAEHGWQRQRLVNDRAVRKRRNVEVLHFFRAQMDANLAAADIETTLKFIVAHALAAHDQEMADRRPAVAGFLAKFFLVHRHFAPSDDIQAEVVQNELGRELGIVLRVVVLTREEKDTNGQIAVIFELIVEIILQDFPEKLVGNLSEDARAIPCLAVGFGRTAVDDIAAGGDAVLQNPVAPRPVDIGHKSDAAGISFQPGEMEGAFIGDGHGIMMIHVVG